MNNQLGPSVGWDYLSSLECGIQDANQ